MFRALRAHRGAAGCGICGIRRGEFRISLIPVPGTERSASFEFFSRVLSGGRRSRARRHGRMGRDFCVGELLTGCSNGSGFIVDRVAATVQIRQRPVFLLTWKAVPPSVSRFFPSQAVAQGPLHAAKTRRPSSARVIQCCRFWVLQYTRSYRGEPDPGCYLCPP